MELDDLRRHWRQPEPAAPLPLPDVACLERQRPADLVRRMRRNARLEAGFTLLVCLSVAGALLQLRDGFAPLYFGLLLAVGAASLLLYRRLLATLARMAEPAGSVRGHLAVLAQGMRQLLRFYYRFTLWTGPVALLLCLGYFLWHGLGQGPAAARWGFLAGIAVGGSLVQVGIVYFTRWYLQRLYGRHLDRLEGQLRELDEH